MKLISWNVNGIRACLQKGFEDAFRTLNADFFCRRRRHSRIRLSWTCRATGSTGTPPRRRATPARRSLPGTSRSP